MPSTYSPVETLKTIGGVASSPSLKLPVELNIRRVKNGWMISDESCYNSADRISIAVSQDDLKMIVDEWVIAHNSKSKDI